MAGLDGKVALVTGAGSGIGAAVARRLAADGASLMLRRPRAGDAAAGVAAALGDRAASCAVDVSRRADWEAAVGETVGELGGLDLLVNCAGITRDRTLLKMTDDEWRAVIDVHLTGTWLGCQHAVPAMRDRGGGAIVNISSEARHGVVRPGELRIRQGRHRRPDAHRGARALAPRRSLQRGRPRAGEHADAGRGAGGGQARLAAADSDAPLRGAGRDRRGRRVPGLGRRVVRDRPVRGGRRRNRMELTLDEVQRELQAVAHDFAEREMRPQAAELRRVRGVPVGRSCTRPPSSVSPATTCPRSTAAAASSAC